MHFHFFGVHNYDVICRKTRICFKIMQGERCLSCGCSVFLLALSRFLCLPLTPSLSRNKFLFLNVNYVISYVYYNVYS